MLHGFSGVFQGGFREISIRFKKLQKVSERFSRGTYALSSVSWRFRGFQKRFKAFLEVLKLSAQSMEF